MSAQCRPRELVCAAPFGLVEAVLPKSRREFLVGDASAFEFCLSMSRDAFRPFPLALRERHPVLVLAAKR